MIVFFQSKCKNKIAYWDHQRVLVDTDYRLISKSPLLSCAFILQWMPLAEFVAQPLIQEDGMFKKIIDICIARLGKHYCGLLPHQVVSKFDGRLSCLYYNVIDAQDVNCRGNWSHPSTISQSQHPSPVVSWNPSGVFPLEERDDSNNSASIRGLTSQRPSKYLFLKNAVLVNEWQHQFFCYYLLL